MLGGIHSGEPDRTATIGIQAVSIGVQPGAADQSGGDGDQVAPEFDGHPGRPTGADMAFHGCQRQEQVIGSMIGIGRARRAAQVIGCTDRFGHRCG